MRIDPSLTYTNVTHLLFVGDGWVEARKVSAPWSEDGYAWHFSTATAMLRWLES